MIMEKCKIVDMDKYYRKGVMEHFTRDCKCSTSITSKIDVTRLIDYSKKTGTKFYINFLYILSKVLNSRDDYKMFFDYKSNQLLCFDKINPIQYIFHEETETCSPVYTEYFEDYMEFYKNCVNDIEKAKQTTEYKVDYENHPNWFDASYISWLSYDSLNIELPDGYLHYSPIINWGRYKFENDKFLMPVSVRINHAIADGYLVAKVFKLLVDEISNFVSN